MDSIEHWQHPSRIRRQRRVLDQAEADHGLVRLSDLARDLGVTPQQIDTWRARSAVNGFPAPIATSFGPHARGGKRRHSLWELAAVRAWKRDYSVAAQRSRTGKFQRKEG